jgi:DNA polymerase-1
LLYEHLGLKQQGKEKWTKSRSRLSAEGDVLKQMIAQSPEIIRTVLDWKEREKLRSTYTYSLIGQMDSGDRIHSDISSTTAETGRLTSSDPNLQNIPTRTKLGKEVRNAFIPSPGNVLGTIDASQIEMRQNAHDANCLPMLDIFWRFVDFYWGIAELMYRRKFTEEERKHGVMESGPAKGLTYKGYYRFNAKTTALMTAYDTSPAGLLDQFLTQGAPGWTEQLCAELIRDFFDEFKELIIRRKEHHRRARKYGFVWDMWGRIRWIPQVKSTLPWVQGEGLRAAGNLAGQGGAAGLIKLWMAVVWKRYCEYWRRHGIRMLMQIHDELICEGPRKVVEDFLAECERLLEILVPLEFYLAPLEGSWEVGERWGELKD